MAADKAAYGEAFKANLVAAVAELSPNPTPGSRAESRSSSRRSSFANRNSHDLSAWNSLCGRGSRYEPLVSTRPDTQGGGEFDEWCESVGGELSLAGGSESDGTGGTDSFKPLVGEHERA